MAPGSGVRRSGYHFGGLSAKEGRRGAAKDPAEHSAERSLAGARGSFQKDLDYGLVGGAALGQLVAPGDFFAVRAIDQGNAFTSLVTPRWWWPLLSGPEVLAGELPASWVRARWSGSIRLRPQYTRLPMGCTHAAFLLMVTNRHAAAKALSRDKK